MSTSQETNPHFAAIGGGEAIARLVDRFYHHMDTLPTASRVRALHPPRLGRVKAIFVHYLIEWMGGPALYSAERGHPRLRRRHMQFPIGAPERDAWMLCMRMALSEVVDDLALRAELDAAFYKIADFICNEPALALSQR
ncbi:MAG TPA: group II truncated hemoglobin [Polyangiales bacterium]|nr:group II truncated hemoglobin [Polyangiales bacterium]